MQQADNESKASVIRSSSSSCFPSRSEVVQPSAQASESAAGEKGTAKNEPQILLPDRKTHVRFAPTSCNRRHGIDDGAASINFPPQGGTQVTDQPGDHPLSKLNGIRPQPLPRTAASSSSRSPLQLQSLMQPQTVRQLPPTATGSTYQSFQSGTGMYQFQPQQQPVHNLQPQQHPLLTRHVHPQLLMQHHHHQAHHVLQQHHHLINAVPSSIKIPFSAVPPLHNHQAAQQQQQMHHPNCQPKISVSIPDVLGSSGGSLTASGGSGGSGSGSGAGSACPQFVPANASPDETASSDLMKSLRCNPTWTSREMGDSPNTESSGYRTKFSPSPREQAGISHISNGSLAYMGQLSSSLV